jgi:hypothetical protein
LPPARALPIRAVVFERPRGERVYRRWWVLRAVGDAGIEALILQQGIEAVRMGDDERLEDKSRRGEWYVLWVRHQMHCLPPLIPACFRAVAFGRSLLGRLSAPTERGPGRMPLGTGPCTDVVAQRHLDAARV